MKSVRRQRLFIREVPRMKGGGSARSSHREKRKERGDPGQTPSSPGLCFFRGAVPCPIHGRVQEWEG